jgi:hypothetical protein
VQLKISSKALLAAGIFGAASLVGAQSLPAVEHSGSIEFLSGGVGSDEAQAIKAVSAQWPLTLEFAVNTQPRADYAAGIKVTVRDARGNTALQATSNGPFLLMRLPPGRYSVDAVYAGQSKRETITLAQGQAQHKIFIWPAG